MKGQLSSSPKIYFCWIDIQHVYFPTYPHPSLYLFTGIDVFQTVWFGGALSRQSLSVLGSEMRGFAFQGLGDLFQTILSHVVEGKKSAIYANPAQIQVQDTQAFREREYLLLGMECKLPFYLGLMQLLGLSAYRIYWCKWNPQIIWKLHFSYYYIVRTSSPTIHLKKNLLIMEIFKHTQKQSYSESPSAYYSASIVIKSWSLLSHPSSFLHSNFLSRIL